MKVILIFNLLIFNINNVNAVKLNYYVKDGKALLVSPNGDKEWVDEDEVVSYYYEGYNPANKDQMFNTAVLKPKYNSPITQALTGVASGLTFGIADWLVRKADPYSYEQRQKYTDPNWHQAGIVIGIIILVLVLLVIKKQQLNKK